MNATLPALPATAWYSHRKALPADAQWHDLPVASFKDSGTNVGTGFIVWRKEA